MIFKEEDENKDIVDFILDLCKDKGLPIDILIKIDTEIREEHGGQRWYVKKKTNVKERRLKTFADGLTGKSNQEIMSEHGISRATLYRLMKRG
jgi:hypothetical protein